MKIREIGEYLGGNSYPGRGIMVGKSADGKNAVMAYFIMGRSINSRNRIFEPFEDGIRTNAVDPSKLEDPSLVIYTAVKKNGENTIVTNGDQTDTVSDFLDNGKTFEESLRTRTFEPDPPIFTPRISSIICPKNGSFTYKMSILKSMNGNPESAERFFFEYEPANGMGHLIHTYIGDGDPVPSFEGEPVPVEISGNIDEITESLWSSLNEENKVSLFVRFIDLETGKSETKIVNKYK